MVLGLVMTMAGTKNITAMTRQHYQNGVSSNDGLHVGGCTRTLIVGQISHKKTEQKIND